MPFQEFAGVHRNVSSKIDIYPEAGVLRKTRPGRSVRNLLNEYLMLVAWRQTLDHYYPDGANGRGAISSPYPVQFSEQERAIVMSFCPGFPLGQAITGTHELQEQRMARQEVLSRIGFGLGRMAAIKLREGIRHGDYQPRHVLFNPLQDNLGASRMHVIDVESTKRDRPEMVEIENTRLMDWVKSALGQGRRGKQMADAYQDGMMSLESGESIWQDAMYVARDEIGL